MLGPFRLASFVSVLVIVAASWCAPSGDDGPRDAADRGDVVVDAPDFAEDDAASSDDWEPGDGSGVEDAEDDGTGPDVPEDVPVAEDGSEDDAEDDGGAPAFPIDEMDDVRLYLNIGDSMAAGYNASGRNGSGGKGYARLVLENHPDYSSYADHSLRALFPGTEFRDLGESGATSADALGNLRGASLPPASGDVVVSLTCGGNDFNDDIWVMILPASTEAAAAALQNNYREIFRIVRERYEDPAAGRRVVFLVTNVHDPTGGTGAIPPGFDEGFCSTLGDPRLAPFRATAISNLESFNTRIAEVVAELGGHLVDVHGVFMDHGMNAPAGERWIDDDCVHPTNSGHDQIRREEWQVLTGERY